MRTLKAFISMALCAVVLFLIDYVVCGGGGHSGLQYGAFLGGLFKRKPGGTTFGNIVRGIAGGQSGGILGSGGMMISQADADRRDMSDADFAAKYGQTKSGIPVQTANPANNVPINTPPVVDPNSMSEKVKKFFQKAWVKWSCAIGACLLIVYLGWKFSKKGVRRYR